MRFIVRTAIGLFVTSLVPSAFGQVAGPLNASTSSVQVPASAVFFEQGTAGSSITANVGARWRDLALSLGFRSGESTGDNRADVFTSADGLVSNGRVTLSLFWARYRIDQAYRALLAETCALHIPKGDTCDERIILSGGLYSAAERNAYLNDRRRDQSSVPYAGWGGGPTVLFARGSVGNTSVDVFNQGTSSTVSQSRVTYDFRFGIGRYVTNTGLVAVSMGFSNSARRPDKQSICANHLVDGMTTTPPTLSCQDRYLSGLSGRENLDIRVEWRQYIGANFAWNPAVTFPWAARDDVASTPTDENVLRIDHIDIESPIYARLGTDLQLHVGVRPAVRFWMGSHSTGPTDLSLAVFLGGSFGLLNF